MYENRGGAVWQIILTTYTYWMLLVVGWREPSIIKPVEIWDIGPPAQVFFAIM